MTEGSPKAVEPPQKFKGRESSRALVEMLASLVPGGGALTRAFQVTHPSPQKKDVDRWQAEITEKANEAAELAAEHEAILRPKREVSTTAVDLAAYIARQCPDGMGDQLYTVDDLVAALGEEHPRDAVEDAVYELQARGLVSIISAGGYVRAEQALFENVDQHIMGWNTIDDARHLAILVLGDEELSSAPNLHKASGWELRRFNPALKHLLTLLPSNRYSEPNGDYPTWFMFIGGEERFALREFVA